MNSESVTETVTEAVTEAATYEPVRWTAEQLAIALGVNFGFTRPGRPDTRAAATALNVASSTVRRWLHPREDGTASIPDHRFGEVQAAVRPTDRTLHDQQLVVDNALAGLRTVRHPRGHRQQIAIWRREDWIAPYVVAIIAPSTVPVQQVTVGRVSSKALEHLERRGRQIAAITVDTKFAALVLAHAVLGEVDSWRISVPPEWKLDGRTQAWLPGAALPHLDELADDLGLT